MKLRHVTIFTAKFEESLKFYQDITGLVLLEDMRPMLGRNLLFLGNAAGETMVELVEVDEAGAYTGSGISMGFVVDDAEKYRIQTEWQFNSCHRPNNRRKLWKSKSME